MRRDDLELRVGAVARRLVRPPAPELRGVAEARALHVVVGDLDDELGSQRLPREVLALAPAALRAGPALAAALRVGRAGPLLPRMIDQRVLAVRRQEGDELAALRVGEARGDADVLERRPRRRRARAAASRRALALAALVPAKARDDAVALALVLHLEHDALVRLVDAGRRLGHHAVEPGALEAPEPVGGDARARRSPASGGAAAARRRAAPRARARRSRNGPAAQVPLALAEQIPEHDRRRESPSRAAPRATPPGWMRSWSASKSSPPSRAITISPSSTQRCGQLRQQRLAQLGEVAVERLLVAALEQELVAVAKHEHAKAVPLRLEDPARRRPAARRRAWRASGGRAEGRRAAPRDSSAAGAPRARRRPRR